MKTENPVITSTAVSQDTVSDSTSVPSLIDQHFICSLFNIKQDDVLHLNCVRDTATSRTDVHVLLKPTSPPCPVCGNPLPKVKDYYTRKINHSVLNDSHTLLLFKDRRYICPHCHKTYFSPNPFTERGFRHSLLTTQMILKDLKDPNMTMSAVSRRYHISPTTVANIFDAHVDIGRKKLPNFLSVDEVYAFRSNRSKYICVMLDYKKKVPVEILPSRTYEDLARFFSSIPIEERQQVKVFSTDMWQSYRSIAKRYLPNCEIIVDHFHVIQECNKRLDTIRLNIQKSFNTGTKEYYLLKKFHWVLFKNDQNLLDPNKKKKYNKKMKQYLNYHDIKCRLQEVHPQLEMAINLKDALCMYYDTIKIIENNDDPNHKEPVPVLKRKADGSITKRSQKIHDEAKKRNSKRILSKEAALQELEELISKYRNCPLIEFSSFANTLNEWKHEIVNSLRVYRDLDRKTVSNAMIENRNKIIKNVKRTSNGYSNWRRFRNRLMYTLDSNSTYSLIADETMMIRKRKRNREHYLKWKERNE